MTIFYSKWPRVIVVESWSRLKTFNAGRKSGAAVLVTDVSGAMPAAEMVPPGATELPAPPDFAERLYAVGGL